MTKSEAIKYFGSATAMARALGVTRQAVSQWDEIPYGRQCELEVYTDRVLRADRSMSTALADGGNSRPAFPSQQ